MVSRTALLFVALAGVTLCVTANADAGLESSAAFGSDALETIEGASGRSLLTAPKTPKKPEYKKYVVFQNAQNKAIIYDNDLQLVIGSGNVVSNSGSNTNNQNAQNSNSGRKLLVAPTTPKPKEYKKYIVFQNAQNKAVIYDEDTQAVVGHGNFVSNYGSNTNNQNAQNFNGR